MAKYKKPNFDTDAKGKQIASQLIQELHSTIFIPTPNKYNKLDGRFEYKGHIYGLESKYADYKERFIKFPTLIIATNKYDYAMGIGKDLSGLTATYMMYYTITPIGSTELYVCNFDNCPNSKIRTLWVPDENEEDAKYHEEDFYIVPLSKARHYEIIDNKVIEINEERQDERYGSSSIEDGPRISCWSL